ncbi:MAG: hypothetical protein U9N52_03825 [Campylobacterota bacterium]|nr:hypothetical protein [Campylobacterota bacterium]
MKYLLLSLLTLTTLLATTPSEGNKELCSFYKDKYVTLISSQLLNKSEERTAEVFKTNMIKNCKEKVW